MRFSCLRSMQQMSEDEHGLESVSAWIETKLRVRFLHHSFTYTVRTFTYSLYIVPLTVNM